MDCYTWDPGSKADGECPREAGLTSSQIRPHVVDLLVDRLKDQAPLTSEEDALMAAATPAEHAAAWAIEQAVYVGYDRYTMGEATEDEERLWSEMPGCRVWEALPLTADLVFDTMDCRWPYTQGVRATLQRWTAGWSVRDRGEFEQRFARRLANGVHWE